MAFNKTGWKNTLNRWALNSTLAAFSYLPINAIAGSKSDPNLSGFTPDFTIAETGITTDSNTVYRIDNPASSIDNLASVVIPYAGQTGGISISNAPGWSASWDGQNITAVSPGGPFNITPGNYFMIDTNTTSDNRGTTQVLGSFEGGDMIYQSLPTPSLEDIPINANIDSTVINDIGSTVIQNLGTLMNISATDDGNPINTDLYVQVSVLDGPSTNILYNTGLNNQGTSATLDFDGNYTVEVRSWKANPGTPMVKIGEVVTTGTLGAPNVPVYLSGFQID